MTLINIDRASQQPGDVAYAFAGRPRIQTLHPGQVLVIEALDCFGDAVHAVADLTSQVCQMPYLNMVRGRRALGTVDAPFTGCRP